MANTRNLATAVAGLAAIPAALAAPVTVSQSVSLGSLLNGSSTTLQFNINALLGSQGLSSGDVLSGTLVVYGLSDPNYGTAQAQPYSAYETTGTAGSHTASYTYYVGGYSSCGWWGGCYYYPGYIATGYYQVTDYNQQRSRDVLHIDNVADQMTTTVGTTSVTATASQQSNSVGAYGNPTYDGAVGGGSGPIYYQYSRERDVYQAIYGPLQTVLNLDNAALTDLQSDGILDALIGALGQFNLTSAELTVIAEKSETPQVNGVPEPGALGLTGLALTAGALAKRRRRKGE